MRQGLKKGPPVPWANPVCQPGISERRKILATELARQKAAQAWCKPSTEKKVMDPELAEEFANILDLYIEGLQWCSGSADFAPGGKARRGWNKIVVPLLKIIRPESS